MIAPVCEVAEDGIDVNDPGLVGATVSTVHVDVEARLVREARVVCLTSTLCGPSVSPVRASGDPLQVLHAPPSMEQV